LVRERSRLRYRSFDEEQRESFVVVVVERRKSL